ncbi:cytochrome c biogenesis protein ResB [Lacisediminimonas sp.]|uniref:cytochrome c biogenesis protein ResB n=1 Tax=Lacisediminimonas sp. TaxID=3060582 RepID=UPI002725DB9F|nr:cytochrome c biogenesis protein ResB [Lacisediminimonas sp.]MDO8299880.1 cytochrome c biogenesis protein ResB [Lacisediminimonas sp.]
METTTTGIELQTERRWLRDFVELLSSMRFAISLLTLIAIASIIGTVLKQNEPMTNYVNQFGPFWFEVFGKLGVYALYSTWWFLLIMGFLVASTSLCILRNAPRMLSDMRSWRENVREQSLRNFHHRAEWSESNGEQALLQRALAVVTSRGYKVKVVAKDGASLLTAKRGAANKWGYIFAHSAIVIICIGGLMDSDLPIRFQQLAFGKTPFAGSGIIADIPAKHRLGLGNPSFRGNTLIPEGGRSNTAILPQASGVLIQELPFTIELKKFIVDFYTTGMPKLFASEVIVTDHETGKQFPATIKVNEPLIYKGMAVYQSSFEDGGTKLKLTGYPMSGARSYAFKTTGEVGANTPLSSDLGNEYTVEWSGFRAFNVENMTDSGDVRAVMRNKSLAESLDARLGSAAKAGGNKDLKNVGPSVQYKLRDKTGQAREFHNYMQPVLVDGAYVFLAGMRESPAEPFKYLRIPADENDSVEEWMRLRAAVQNPALREQSARRYANKAMSATGDAAMQDRLRQSALRGLEIFAGDDQQSGFLAVSRFLEKIPAAEQEKAADIFMKILNGSMWELWQVAREADGLKAVAPDQKNGQFLQIATGALADSFFYRAPVFLQLNEFDEVKASVLQVTRSPGKNVVYVGCLLLVLGVFAMLYIRERRLWIWVRSAGHDGGAHALMAMSTQRKTLDFESEFESMKRDLTGAASPASPLPPG